MTKTTVQDWSTTEGNNTLIGSIDIDEGCEAKNMNNAAREMMAQIATYRDELTAEFADVRSERTTAFKGVSPVDFGFFGGGPSKTATQNEQAMRDAIGELETQNGGGAIQFGPGTYTIGASQQGGLYEAGGREFAASRYAIVIPSGKVSLIGNQTRFRVEDAGLGGIMAVSPDRMRIADIEVDGAASQLNTSGNSGLYTVTPSAATLTNLLTSNVNNVDFTASFGGFVSTDASITLSNSGTRLRMTYSGGYTGPHHVRSGGFSATANQEIRVSIRAYSGTLGTTVSTDRISVSLATNPTSAASRVAGTTTTVRPDGNYRFDYTATIPANGTYYLHIHGNTNNGGTEADYAGTYFEVDEVKLAVFPLTDQRLWCRDLTVERVYAHGFSTYCFGLQGDHDTINTRFLGCRAADAGLDLFDSKNRGPGTMNEGLIVDGFHGARGGLRVDGGAMLDFHGPAWVRNVFLEEFGRDGDSQTGVRFRTLADPDIPYEGLAARGSALHGFRIIGNGLGDVIGVNTGSASVSIQAGLGSGLARGIVVAGNTFGAGDRSDIAHVTIDGATDVAFDIKGANCNASDCTAIGGAKAFDVSGDNCSLRDCNEEGSATPLTYTGSGLAIWGGNIEQDKTWTPIYTDGVNNAVSYTIQEGRYSWVGRTIEAQCQISPSDIGSVTGVSRIAGLPRAAANIPDIDHSLPASSFSGMNFGGIGVSPMPVVQHGQDFVIIQVEDGASGTTAVTTTQFPAGGRIAFSGRYRID